MLVCLYMIFLALRFIVLNYKMNFRITFSNCERSELSGLFNARIFYIYQAVRRAVNVLNVSTCI